jgi:hypothetical protein
LFFFLSLSRPWHPPVFPFVFLLACLIHRPTTIDCWQRLSTSRDSDDTGIAPNFIILRRITSLPSYIQTDHRPTFGCWLFLQLQNRRLDIQTTISCVKGLFPHLIFTRVALNHTVGLIYQGQNGRGDDDNKRPSLESSSICLLAPTR